MAKFPKFDIKYTRLFSTKKDKNEENPKGTK